MLQKDPSSRASLEEIEAHDWLKDLDNALLTPEAPPPWLTLSPSSPHSGAPECGDLLAAKPQNQTPFPGPWQPSLTTVTLRTVPAQDSPTPKTAPALQQICEEEEEEEKEEEEQEDITKQGFGSPLLKTETEEKVSHKDDQIEIDLKEEQEVKMVDTELVVSDQPMSRGDVSPLCSMTCSQFDCEEPNNNTNKLPAPVPSAPTLPSTLGLDFKDTHKTATGLDKRAEEGGREEPSSDRPLSHNALQNSDSAPRADQAKRHSIKLRERIFQFPLCEKALAFNIPAQNKSKILPLAQYNCCRVL